MAFVSFKLRYYTWKLGRFLQFAKAENLPLTTRSSFSFINSSLTFIAGKEPLSKLGLEGKLRLNVGLESEEAINRYADFLGRVHNVLASKRKKQKSTNSLLE
jgi:hypothetical protein